MKIDVLAFSSTRGQMQVDARIGKEVRVVKGACTKHSLDEAERIAKAGWTKGRDVTRTYELLAAQH